MGGLKGQEKEEITNVMTAEMERGSVARVQASRGGGG